MIVFLDFDGVTHPHSRDHPPFGASQISLLDEVLEEIAGQVVIISSWRDEMPLNELVTLLRDVGKHVIGIAPEEPACTRTPRQEVVEQWLAESGDPERDWIAIDDNPAWYGGLAGRVIAPNPARGFSGIDANRLRRVVDRVRAGDL